MDEFLIVTGWDGSPESEHAVRVAGRYAQRARGRVRLVLAWDYITQPAHFDPDFDSDAAKAHVQEAARRLLPADIPVETVAVLGRAHEAILEQAGDAQLIVIGRSGLGHVFARLLGSTATSVVRDSRIPVMVVPTAAAEADEAAASAVEEARDG